MKPEISNRRCRRLTLSFIAVLTMLAPLLSAQNRVTGLTLSLDGETMYYFAETGGEYLLCKSSKNRAGGWDAGVADTAFNRYIKGKAVKTPFLTYDGSTLYLSIMQIDEQYDIFYSKRQGEVWTEPVKSPVINTEYDEMSPALTADNRTIYFTRYNRETGCFSIYSAQTESQGWSLPQVLPLPVNTGCESHVNVSPTGGLLLFSSDRFAERRRKRYDLLYTEHLGTNLWSPPVRIDDSRKEYSEFNPVVDYRNDKLYFMRGSVDSLIYTVASIFAPAAIIAKPFSTVRGTVSGNDGKPVAVEIEVYDNYTNTLYCKSANNAVTGEYAVVLPNGGSYSLNYFRKNGAKKTEIVQTQGNAPAQNIAKNVRVFDNLTIHIDVKDAISNKYTDAELQIFDKNRTSTVDSLEEGRFVITASTTSSIEIDIHKDYYRNETVSVNITDYPEFPELYYQVRLQPDLRSGTVNVRELSGNKGIDAKVTVTNLDIRDDETAVSSKTTGKYEFGLRKNCKYSISVTLPGHSYFYTVWKADINRVSQTLNVNPVRLEDLSRIPVSYLVFGEGESALSPEASGELQCIAGVLRDNPSYNAVISLYHTAAEAEIVQQRRKNIITFMDLSRTPGSRYRIEPVQVSQPKLPDISFNAVQTANTNTNK